MFNLKLIHFLKWSHGINIQSKVFTQPFDNHIVWYGAVNALGYATEEDNVIKVVDNKLANELLEVLLTS